MENNLKKIEKLKAELDSLLQQTQNQNNNAEHGIDNLIKEFIDINDKLKTLEEERERKKQQIINIMKEKGISQREIDGNIVCYQLRTNIDYSSVEEINTLKNKIKSIEKELQSSNDPRLKVKTIEYLTIKKK
jgi:flagellar biosynthesis chaperone FliJ